VGGKLTLILKTPQDVHITAPSVAFAVLMEGGFGRIVVGPLEPGQRETVTINGRQVTVIRDYLQ
jgi:hypothetical protein